MSEEIEMRGSVDLCGSVVCSVRDGKITTSPSLTSTIMLLLLVGLRGPLNNDAILVSNRPGTNSLGGDGCKKAIRPPLSGFCR